MTRIFAQLPGNHPRRTSRRLDRRARAAAQAAAQAFRGELSRARWRWLVAGLAAGVTIGVAGAAVVARGRRIADPATDQEQTTAPTFRERASDIAQTARERTTAVARNAAATAAQVREKLNRDKPASEPEPMDHPLTESG